MARLQHAGQPAREGLFQPPTFPDLPDRSLYIAHDVLRIADRVVVISITGACNLLDNITWFCTQACT